jgi:hypothetical protein
VTPLEAAAAAFADASRELRELTELQVLQENAAELTGRKRAAASQLYQEARSLLMDAAVRGAGDAP